MHRDANLVASNDWAGSTARNDYAENFTYDPNGNILYASRNAHGSTFSNGTATGLDDLEYVYETIENGYEKNTNKLRQVIDSRTELATDIAGDLEPDNPQNVVTLGHRYGFNGEEFDTEWNSGGAMYDYGMRIYDPRLGKFLSVDPLMRNYTMLTPYQFASNQPIWAIDLDGLERKIVITDQHGYKIELELGKDGVDKDQITQTVLGALGWDYKTYEKFIRAKYGEDEMFLWESSLSLQIATYTDANGYSQASLKSSSVAFDASKLSRAWRKFDRDMRELDKEYPWLRNEMWEGEANFKERGWKLMVAGPVMMFTAGFAIAGAPAIIASTGRTLKIVWRLGGKDFVIEASKDAFLQLVTKKGDLSKVDWADAFAQGAFNVKGFESFKDAFKSLVDFSAEEGGLNINTPDQATAEYIIRTFITEATKDAKISKELDLLLEAFKKIVTSGAKDAANDAIQATK